MGVCGTLLETLTLFQTKICDFPNPISDLIKNLIPFFSPGARRVTPLLLHVHGWRKHKREMVLSPNDEEEASSKKHTQLKPRVQNTLFQTKTAKKHTLWRRTDLYSLYKEYPLIEKRVADFESRCLRNRD